MDKWFKIKKGPFSISFHNRELLAYYDHYLMYFDLDETNIVPDSGKWTIEEISTDNVYDCSNDIFSCGRMKRYLLQKTDCVKGFLFREPVTNQVVGFLWAMCHGENEFQYRVRKADALIFDVYVSPKFRGLGICGEMFQHMFGYLKNQQLKMIVLGVRTDNASAIRAYKKLGGIIKSRKRWIQLCHRYNLPYYSV
ncbi:GNAT family N-acetyltransferase [bacterium]|nr:GNAT family N-acetyltransferase [bacterium]